MKPNHSPVALLATVLALLIAVDSVQAADAPKPIEVKTATPTRGEIFRFVTLPGSIKANQQATLYAKVPGYLKSIAVDKAIASPLARRSAKLKCRNWPPKR
jgi:multidrug efflux pump subunit AcrA (membrane-fusion protein)